MNANSQPQYSPTLHRRMTTSCALFLE